jgi:eukaryotic-like serine/threonine-protein kinase
VIDPIFSGGEVLAGRYRVERYHAEGGMQQVYLATDEAFDRPVALKVPKNPSAEKRFARSARMSARVNHVNIAKTLDYFEERGRSHLVEEFIDGRDLAHAMEREFEFLDPHLAAHVFHHIARGVAAAHHAGVLHRDLKPSNVMTSRDAGCSFVKVTDFGIAKMAEEEVAEAVKDNDSITASKTVVGALPYMAPEMIEKPREAGLAADIWSTGAILFHLLTGQLPFGGGLVAVRSILLDPVPRKPKLLETSQFSALADDLWSIVESCLEKDPLRRPTGDGLLGACAELCYSNEPRKFGVVEEYGTRPGATGLIKCASTGQRVFFHIESYYGRSPASGIRVSFADFEGSPHNRAFPVLPIRPLDND